MTQDRRSPTWTLRLYVDGASPRSLAAVETVQRICDEELPGSVDLAVVDVRKHPDTLQEDGVLALPTLVRRSPAPTRRLVGDLADPQRIRSVLEPPEPSTEDGAP